MPVELLARYAGKNPPAGQSPIIEGMDGDTLAALRTRLTQLKKNKVESEEMCDTEAVEQADADVAVLEPLIKRAFKANRNAPPSPEQKDAHDLVVREVATAISTIRKLSHPLAEHLEKEIQTGYVFWYRRTGIPWVIEDTSPSVEAPVAAVVPGRTSSAAVLTIDLRVPRVRFRGQEIPTSGPNNLQHQPLFALAVLAQHAGQTLSMEDLATEMPRIGWKDKSDIAPDQKQLRYKLINPFRCALKDILQKTEIDRLVESIPKMGLRLNLEADQISLDLRTAPTTEATAAQ